MISTVVAIKGEPQPLKLLVDDLSRHMKLGIDATRVYSMLGDKIVEKVEERQTYDLSGNVDGCIRKVVAYVKP